MNMKFKSIEKKKKVAWGISGSGHQLTDIMNIMKEVKSEFQDELEIRVFLSKAGEQVIKSYKLYEQLKQDFVKVWVEVNSNSPFIAGSLELGRFEFLLIAPATSNTVAKLAAGITDTLLCNSAIMALKGFVPVYIMPSDYRVGKVVTKLPDGNLLSLRVRKEDAENTRKLSLMENMTVLEKPEDIIRIFRKHFSQKENK
jgi:archaeoflavoprotein AfpA